MNRTDDGEHQMDILFPLTPGFTDSARDREGKRYSCPDCALLEGVLGCCPELRTRLDIRYVDSPRPRHSIVELVGDAHQGCPNLVLDPANHGFVDASTFHKAGDPAPRTNEQAGWPVWANPLW